MLFRACTSRLGRVRTSLLTGQDATQSWKSEVIISNDRTPDVLDLAINLLDPACFPQGRSGIAAASQSEHKAVVSNNEVRDLVATERIFAALDLIGRISTSFNDAGRIERLVLEKLNSTVWQVREQAARIFASRLSPWDALDVLGRMVDGMFKQKDQNMIHGRLLCIKEILRNLWRSRAEPLSQDLGRAATLLEPLITPILAEDMSIVVQTTFLDVLNDAFETEILSRTSGIMSRTEVKHR